MGIGGVGGINASSGGGGDVGVVTGYGGSGGANTGGGGGSGLTGIGGNGGSGIVVIAFSTTEQSLLVTNYNFTSPTVTLNTASTLKPTLTSWTTTGSAGNYYILNGTGGATYNFNQCPYGQFFYSSTNTNVRLFQTLVLSAKTYTMSFCAAVNSAFIDNTRFVEFIMDGVFLYSTLGNMTTTSTSWNVYTFDFTISAGSHTLWINTHCPMGITQLLIY